MSQPDFEGLSAAHRQSRDGAMIAIGASAKRRIDERNEIFDHHILESAAVAAPSFRRRRRRACPSGVAFLHDDDHWSGLASRDQVIQNKVNVALPAPTRFVFAGTMLQIENWIAARIGR